MNKGVTVDAVTPFFSSWIWSSVASSAAKAYPRPALRCAVSARAAQSFWPSPWAMASV